MRRHTARYSRTLAQGYEVRAFRRGSVDTVRIRNVYFFSGILDKGRGEVRPRAKRNLIWFENPLKDDPRLRGGYPRKKSEVRTLTPSQYRDGLRRNAIRKQAGRRPYMIVAQRSRAVPGKHFVRNARPELVREVKEAVKDEFDLFGKELRRDLAGRHVLSISF